MRNCVCVFAFFIALGSTAVSSAQTGQDKQVEELQRQISDLKRQLDRLQAPPSNNRVTQIGAAAQAPLRVPETVVRFYDLSDLFMAVPAYRAERFDDLGGNRELLFPQLDTAPSGGAGMGGGGAGFFNARDDVRRPPERQRRAHFRAGGESSENSAGNLAAARTSIDDLIETITSTISPESWDALGGPGTIARLGGAMVVSTTPEVHEQIDSLLSLFRKRWGGPRVVSVRAWWLWLDDAQMAALLDVENAADDAELGVAAVVNEQAWKQTLAQLAERHDTDSGYRAALSCYNGQTAYSESGGQSLAVTNLQPTAFRGEKDKDGRQSLEVGYEPQITVLQAGATLQLTPIASSSGKFVVLDVHSRVTRVRPEDKRRLAETPEPPSGSGAQPEEVAAAIDRPVVASQRISTTMRVPVDRVTLVGGMTFDREHGVAPGALYLFVKTAVREVHEQPAEEAPMAMP